VADLWGPTLSRDERPLDDVIASAAIVDGNDLDDFLTRDEARWTLFAASGGEIACGQARLKTLDEQLSHFKFLKPLCKNSLSGFKIRAEKAAGRQLSILGRSPRFLPRLPLQGTTTDFSAGNGCLGSWRWVPRFGAEVAACLSDQPSAAWATAIWPDAFSAEKIQTSPPIAPTMK
jgi:hypothetical protein